VVRRGRPCKSGSGLTRVLFVRVDSALLELLDRRLLEERARRPGHCISRADIARECLYAALKE
jgi:hypothetical protein